LENAFEDEELLAASVDVRGEVALRGIAHNRRRAGDLVTQAIEHSALDTRHGRCLPTAACGMHGDTFIEISIYVHVCAPSLHQGANDIRKWTIASTEMPAKAPRCRILRHGARAAVLR